MGTTWRSGHPEAHKSKLIWVFASPAMAIFTWENPYLTRGHPLLFNQLQIQRTPVKLTSLSDFSDLFLPFFPHNNEYLFGIITHTLTHNLLQLSKSFPFPYIANFQFITYHRLIFFNIAQRISSLGKTISLVFHPFLIASTK